MCRPDLGVRGPRTNIRQFGRETKVILFVVRANSRSLYELELVERCVPTSLSRHCHVIVFQDWYLRPVNEIKPLCSVPVYLPIVDEDDADELVDDEDEEGGGGVRHL